MASTTNKTRKSFPSAFLCAALLWVLFCTAKRVIADDNPPEVDQDVEDEVKIANPIRVLGTHSYDKLPDDKRCRWLESAPDVWVANDTETIDECNTNPNKTSTISTLDQMFRRIVRIYQADEKYRDKLTVASSPDSWPPKVKRDYYKPEEREEENDEEEEEDSFYLHEGDGGPWVLLIDDFLHDDEVIQLTKLGKREGFEKSTIMEDDDEKEDHEDEDDDDDHLLDIPQSDSIFVTDSSEKGDPSEPSTIKTRTSRTSWCQSKTCKSNEVYQDVIERVFNLVQLERVNSEDLQFLKYNVGQFYNAHHDYYFIEDDHEWNQDGGRILTAFFYLNDVEGGGETYFPRLNLTVTPKKGRLVVWPSVLDSDPQSIDWRTEHAALKVTKGVKYGANFWFHLKAFRRMWYNYECDGDFQEGHEDEEHEGFLHDEDEFDNEDEFDDEEGIGDNNDEHEEDIFKKYGLRFITDEDEDDDVVKDL